MTAASKLLPSEEPAALPSLAQPLHRLVKDGRWGSGRRPAACSSGWQGHAGTVVCTPTPSASDTLVRPAWGLQKGWALVFVCVCVCEFSHDKNKILWNMCVSWRCSALKSWQEVRVISPKSCLGAQMSYPEAMHNHSSKSATTLNEQLLFTCSGSDTVSLLPGAYSIRLNQRTGSVI